MKNFLNYVFYRSYVGIYKSKRKNEAEARSIMAVLLYVMLISFSILALSSSLFTIPAHHVNRNILLIIVAPIFLLSWSITEKRYKKISENDYQQLRNKFNGNRFNKLIPFWMIWIFPIVLFVSTIIILGLFKHGIGGLISPTGISF